MLTRLWRFVLDLIFPIRCVGCGEHGDFLCVDCLPRIQLLREQNCPVCWRPNVGGQTCLRCRKKSPLTGLIVAGGYHKNSILERAIKQIKYRFSAPLASRLSELLVAIALRNVVLQQYGGPENFVFTFVPMHDKREKLRGFNQAKLLAIETTKKLELPLQDLLIRTRVTRQQAKLHRAERLKNLVGAFAMNSGRPEMGELPSLAGQRIIVIDDVATTGATLIECAKVLKKAGASQVWGLVLARG
jgi:ComF family protein